jgi:hypothetical protein
MHSRKTLTLSVTETDGRLSVSSQSEVINMAYVTHTQHINAGNKRRAISTAPFGSLANIHSVWHSKVAHLEYLKLKRLANSTYDIMRVHRDIEWSRGTSVGSAPSDLYYDVDILMWDFLTQINSY